MAEKTAVGVRKDLMVEWECFILRADASSSKYALEVLHRLAAHWAPRYLQRRTALAHTPVPARHDRHYSLSLEANHAPGAAVSRDL